TSYIASPTRIYACYQSQNAPDTTDLSELFVDSNGDGAALSSTDYRLTVRPDGTTTFQQGGPSGYVPTTIPSSFSAARFQFEFDWSTEFSVARSLLSGSSGEFRLMHRRLLTFPNPDVDSRFPQSGDLVTPATWRRFAIDSVPLRADF